MKNAKNLYTMGLVLLMLAVMSPVRAQNAAPSEEFNPSPALLSQADREKPNDKPPLPPISADAEQVSSNLRVEVFPNPNSGHFTVKINNEGAHDDIIITNILGQVIHRERISPLQKECSIVLPNAPQGIYLLNIGKSTLKFKIV